MLWFAIYHDTCLSYLMLLQYVTNMWCRFGFLFILIDKHMFLVCSVMCSYNPRWPAVLKGVWCSWSDYIEWAIRKTGFKSYSPCECTPLSILKFKFFFDILSNLLVMAPEFFFPQSHIPLSAKLTFLVWFILSRNYLSSFLHHHFGIIFAKGQRKVFIDFLNMF